MEQSETLARVEKLTRAVLSSDDGGVPLARFSSDYQRMTKTQFPWREYGFSSARDMLLSMENIVEFKFSDEENQFYLLPAAHVTRNSADNSRNSGTWSRQSKSVASTERINSSRVLHSSINSCQPTASSDSNADEPMPSLVETTGRGNGLFTFDHHGRVSVYVSQSKEKPAQGYWNRQNLTKLFSPFGNVIDIFLMPNKKSGFVRFGTIEEAKRALESLNRTLISADGNMLLVRPGITKQQKIGQPVVTNQSTMLNKKQPPIVVSKPVATRPVNNCKVSHKMSRHHLNNDIDDDDDDDDDVWDDGLLPKNNCCNGNHNNKGIVNGMAALGVSNSVSLCEMFVSEVISPGLLWLKDANLSGRDLQLISLTIELEQTRPKKLASWTLPKEGTVYCINMQEVDKNDKSLMKWFRVIVNKVLQSSEQVEVRYVDTGMVGTLSMALLHVLPLSCQLREIPPAVIPCHLWGVASTHDNREWWPLDCQLLWTLIRNKKVFAKLRSDVIHVYSDNVEHCIPVELFFDSSGKDDIRNHLIEKGHFLVLTDTNIDRTQNDTDDDTSANTAVKSATPTQEGVATMWKPSPRKASTDPLPKPHSIIKSHNHSQPATSPLMWKPTKLVPTSFSFSEQ